MNCYDLSFLFLKLGYPKQFLLNGQSACSLCKRFQNGSNLQQKINSNKKETLEETEPPIMAIKYFKNSDYPLICVITTHHIYIWSGLQQRILLGSKHSNALNESVGYNIHCLWNCDGTQIVILVSFLLFFFSQ